MVGSQDTFGSIESTGKKLDIIREYLGMYQKAMKSNGYFKTYYVDAFAGTGEIQTKTEAQDDAYWFGEEVESAVQSASIFIEGSTQIAVNVEPSFDQFVFIENDKMKLLELKTRFHNHPLKDKISYQLGDANDQVREFCKNMSGGDRAVVFLDPFGSQVSWKTIKAIAETKAVDMWYLFPAGLSVFRQISSKGTVHKTHAPSLDRIFGTTKWRQAFLKPKPNPTLFDLHATINEKIVTPESAADFMIERMRNVFEGGVADFKIPLGKHSYPSYYLLFAWANPSKPARALATKLSKAAVRASENKNGRSF